MQMTYRMRGGLNGRGGIIKGPPRKPLFQLEESTHMEQSMEVLIENENQHLNQVTTPSMTQSPTSPDTSTTTTPNGTPSTLTNTDQSLVISDETGNPAKPNVILHPEGELW